MREVKMLIRSDFTQGIILCWKIDLEVNKFWQNYWLVLEVNELSFKIEMLGSLDDADKVKEIHFDDLESLTHMEISSPDEAYLHLIKIERELVKERDTKKWELRECEREYDEFHKGLMDFKSKYKPHLIPEAVC